MDKTLGSINTRVATSLVILILLNMTLLFLHHIIRPELTCFKLLKEEILFNSLSHGSFLGTNNISYFLPSNNLQIVVYVQSISLVKITICTLH